MGREEYNGVGSAVLVGGGESLCEKQCYADFVDAELGRVKYSVNCV